MQIILPARPVSRGIPLLSIVSGLVAGAILVSFAGTVAYVTLATPFLERVSAPGPLTASRILVGVLAWTFALTAPVGFGLVGVLRILTSVDRVVNRKRPTPTVRAAKSLGDDVHVAAGAVLPDGRPVPELVIGPFGAAVIAEMPPARSTRRQNASWERKLADGRWHLIESPLDRTVRDAERVRRWLGAEDRDFVVKVHAAVVDASRTTERTPTCAVITAEQIPAWLASLPSQRGMTADRRDQLVERIRALL